ncbi:MAG TPA: YetF domain-containing protein [Gaiellaceae bacterium]
MDIVLRAIVVFIFLMVLTRVIGRRELSSLQPFDLILLIVLGDAVQQGLTQDDYSLTGALLAVGTIALLQVFVSYVSWRFPKSRKVIEGTPIIVVQDGKPIDRNLKRERIDIDDVAEEARQQGIAHLDDVKWAVLETTGKISFIKNDS